MAPWLNIIVTYRGVGLTVPGVQVFPDDAEGTGFRIRLASDPLYNITADAMARTYSRFTAYNGLVEARTSHVSPYVTTSLVARDMLEITQAHGFDKLQYWGFS